MYVLEKLEENDAREGLQTWRPGIVVMCGPYLDYARYGTGTVLKFRKPHSLRIVLRRTARILVFDREPVL